MKDKLVKTGHKHMYYVLKKSVVASFVFVSVGFVVAFPTYITMSHIESENLNAQEKLTVNKDNETGEDSKLISYDDGSINEDVPQ